MMLLWQATARLSRARAERRRARREGGAVAIEAALLTPLLLLLFFGIIEFGMLYKDYLAVTSSVRAGARMASAEPRVTTYAIDAADQVAKESAALDMNKVDELWVYKAKANGYPVGASGETFNTCTVCVKFAWDNSAKKFVKQAGTDWLATQQNACSGDAAHDTVGVYMKFTYQGVTGLIFNEMPLEEHTVMSLEPIPTTKTCK